jgi:hypothetical protein
MMDVTEYWATLVSIVIGLGIADLLLNLHRLIHERKRVAWDPLPLGWALVAILWMLNYWYAVATNGDGSRNAPRVAEFALLLISPVQLFLVSASVLPRSLPEQGRLDMREAWTQGRSVFFTIFAIHLLTIWVHVSVVRQSIVFDFASVVRTVSLVIFSILLFVRVRWVEWVGLLVTLGLLLARLSMQQVR